MLQKVISLYKRNIKIEFKLLNLNSLTFKITVGANIYTSILSFPCGTGPVCISALCILLSVPKECFI